MKKKFLSVLLSLAMLLTLLPTTALAGGHGHGGYEGVTALPNVTGTDTKYYLISSDTVTLTGNWVIGNGSDEVTVNLCLNGKVLDLNGHHIEVKEKAELILWDCDTTTKHYFTVDKTGPWTLKTNATDAEIAAAIELDAVTADTEDGTLVEVTGGVITGGNNVSGVYVSSGSAFIMNGGTIAGNTTPGVNSAGNFTMNGGTITGNTATGDKAFVCGGVMVTGGAFTMNGGTIAENKASSNWFSAGGVFVRNGSFTMTDGEIRNNTATTGGGVCNANTFTMTGGTISGNTATGNGGGVYNYSDSGTFTMSDGTIFGNKASDGGGVYISAGTVTMSDTAEIAGNTAGNMGGGVYNGGTFTMNDGDEKITGNTAGNKGGGVYNTGVTFIMTDGTISGNKAAGDGGGVCSVKSFTMSGGEIVGNKATSGGGVYVNGGNADFAMSGTAKITGNEATTGGGAYIGLDAKFNMSGTAKITKNVASVSGGGVSISNTSSATVTLGGGVQITDNLLETGWDEDTCEYTTAANNLYLPFVTEYGTVKLGTGGDAPAEGMKVGVTIGDTDDPYSTIFTDSDTDIAYFFSDNDSYYVTEADSKLSLEAVDGNTVLNVTQGKVYTDLTTAIGGVSIEVGANDTLKLLNNVTGNVTVDKKITLDLNGKVLSGTGDGSVITIGKTEIPASTGNLTLIDSNPTAKHTDTSLPAGGVITGGNSSGNGGGVFVGKSTSFTMNAGTITGNKAHKGGGVYVNTGAEFTMNGGRITGNTASTNGGGVFVVNEDNVTLGGTAKITGNFKGDTANNLYLPTGKTVTISSETAPEPGMVVGVTTQTVPNGSETVTITAAPGYSAEKYFTSDNVAYTAVNPQSNYVALIAVDNTKSVINVSKNKQFATLSEALTDAGDNNQCIRLLADVEENITISKNVTLDLNGHMLKGTGSVITVSSSKTLTLIDTNPTAKHTDTSLPAGGCITDGDAEKGGGVYVNGTFNMYGGNIVRNTADDGGGGVYVNGTFKMYGGSITDNKAASGGGVYVKYSSTFVMTGGEITRNTATTDGGGVYVAAEAACLAAGTPITLADGTRKPIETLQIGDEVRVFDHETGTVTTAKLFDLWKYPEQHTDAFTLHFSNGIDVTAVGGHCFFDKAANKYVAVTKENVKRYIGHQFYNLDAARWETLTGVDFLEIAVDTYIIVTEKHLNCAANGMLSNEDGIYDILINLFAYGDDLKIDAARKAADLQEYGIWEFENAQYMSEDFYDALNLQYMNVAFGKGMITPEMFEALGAYTVEIDPELICGPAVQQCVDEAGETCFLATATSVQNALPAGVTLGGTAKITGNTVKGKPNNVYLYDDTAVITISTTTPPADGFSVSVAKPVPTKNVPRVAFTSNGGPADKYGFFSDQEHKVIFEPAHLEFAYIGRDESERRETPSGGDSESTVTVPVSGDKDSVKVQATISGSNATIKNVTSAEIETVGTGDNVVVDLSGVNKSVTAVTIPKTTFDNVAASEADGLEIKFPNGTVAVFDSTTVAAVAEQAAGSSIQLVVDQKSKAEQALTSAQKATVKELNNALVIEAYFVSNGKRISDFKGGSADLTVSYPTTKPVRVWYLAEDGTKELVPSTFDGKTAKFTVTHFSHYAIELLDGSSYAACPKDATCVYAKFTDANTKAWYHDGVHYCVENGMMNGVTATEFAPNATLTRGMVVAVLARLNGVETIKGNSWYVPGMEWAMANGISDGTNMTGAITREQLATMLYRYAQFKKVDVNKFTENTNTLSHNDVFTVSDWATSGMHFCIAAGVVNGDNYGNLNPRSTATRAEAAAMFQRFSEKVVK